MTNELNIYNIQPNNIIKYVLGEDIEMKYKVKSVFTKWVVFYYNKPYYENGRMVTTHRLSLKQVNDDIKKNKAQIIN